MSYITKKSPQLLMIS